MERSAAMSIERHTAVVSYQIWVEYSQEDYGRQTGIIKQFVTKIEIDMLLGGRGIQGRTGSQVEGTLIRAVKRLDFYIKEGPETNF